MYKAVNWTNGETIALKQVCPGLLLASLETRRADASGAARRLDWARLRRVTYLILW